MSAVQPGIVFFDIDETLVDQRRAEAMAGRRFLEAFGHELGGIGVEAFCRAWRALREKHARAYFEGRLSHRDQRRCRMRDLFGSLGQQLGTAELDRRYEMFEQHYQAGWEPFDDVDACCRSLDGWRLGVIANGNGEHQRRKLEKTGLADWFEVVVVSEDVGVAKPDTRIFVEACRAAGCSPDLCVHVGDRADADARASAAAGLRGIWLNRRRVRSGLRVEHIHSLTQLPERLDAAPAAMAAES